MSRYLLPVVMWLIFANTCYTSAQEFKEYTNGLIYDKHTMTALHSIVDSMNIKYRKCDPWKSYYSLPQAKCHCIYLDSFKVRRAKKHIKANISFDDFCNKYPRVNVEKNLIAIKTKSKDYKERKYVQFSTLEMGDVYSRTVDCKDTALYDKHFSGNWVYEYSRKSKYSRKSIRALYFETDFNSTIIPEKYGRMVRYNDCMIDTNSEIFTGNATDRDLQYELNQNLDKRPVRIQLTKLIDRYTVKPEEEKFENNLDYFDAYHKWDAAKDSMIQALLSDNNEFKSLLREAIIEALQNGISDEELERLSNEYDTKEHTLKLKRQRIVIGGCSHDLSPRIHAQQIAVLAAETASWDIFLRAHLDIMNDRFPRMSDASYVWGKRNTYIKELELLGFDVETLMLGISLRVKNTSGNHYYGSISRIGRALSETENKLQIENAMDSAIRDNQLDVVNRILVYYIYDNYIYNLNDTSRKSENIIKLRNAVSALPKEYRERIVVKEAN